MYHSALEVFLLCNTSKKKLQAMRDSSWLKQSYEYVFVYDMNFLCVYTTNLYGYMMFVQYVCCTACTYCMNAEFVYNASK